MIRVTRNSWISPCPIFLHRNDEETLRAPPRKKRHVHIRISRKPRWTLISRTSDYYLGATGPTLGCGPGGSGRANTFPVLGWPNFARLFGDKIGARLTHDIFNLRPRRYLCPKTAYERQSGRDPVSIALAEAGALHADQREFWTPSGNGQPEYPLWNSHFKVPRLPGRQVRKNAKTSAYKREFDSELMRVANIPAASMTRNAYPQPLASPPRARFWDSFVRGVSLVFRPQYIPMDA